MDPEGIGAMGQPEDKKTSIDVAEAAERPGHERGPRTGEEVIPIRLSSVKMLHLLSNFTLLRKSWKVSAFIE